MLKILAPKGEVFPYLERAKEYLLASATENVADYFIEIRDQACPVRIEWQSTDESAAKFLVQYARKRDFSDVISVEADGVNSIDVYNLYKSSEYFVKVTAFDKNGGLLSCAESTFQTTSLGPRVMMIENICNVRDFGGYETSSGKTLAQGVAYRGGSLTPLPRNPLDTMITDDGKAYMRDVLGIKAEIDLRSEEESGIPLAQGSVIPGVKLQYLTINGYDAAMKEPERFRKVFSAFADKSNYPLYYHCTAGSDRTGTVTFLLYAFLGVSEFDCIKSHEFSSFSIYGERNTKTGESSEWFRSFYDRLQSEYAGDTLQEKAKNYLRAIGVTQSEMDNIKGIFFGEIPIPKR